MHNYSVQNRYTTKTKLGNWYQESQKNDHEFKQFLYQKQAGNNTALNTTSKLAFLTQPVSLTTNTDNMLHNGHCIMLQNSLTQGLLSFNLNEQLISDKEEQSYAVTTTGSSNKGKQLQLRNCWWVEVVGEEAEEYIGKAIMYGDKIRLFAFINGQKLYLQSIPISPMRSSKFSRLQQVSITSQLTSASIWVIDHPNPKLRIDSIGQPVSIDSQILIKHNSTAQHLASDKVNYINQFGQQYQTYAKSILSNNKTQNLFAQKVGHKSVQEPLRGQGLQNYWSVIVGRQ